MAKKSKLSEAPWAMSKREFEKFIPITELNRENAKKLGRIFYTISVMGKMIEYRGFCDITPCFTKGKWRYTHAPFHKSPFTHGEVYITSDWDRSEWAARWKQKLDEGIESKTLYINPSDPLIKYEKL